MKLRSTVDRLRCNVCVAVLMSFAATPSLAQSGFAMHGEDVVLQNTWVDAFNPAFYRIPRSAWGNNDMGPGGTIYTGEITIRGQQGGTWQMSSTNPNDPPSSDYIYFRPTSECSAGGFGLCQYSPSSSLADIVTIRVRQSSASFIVATGTAVSFAAGQASYDVDLSSLVTSQATFTQCSQGPARVEIQSVVGGTAVPYGDPAQDINWGVRFTPNPGGAPCQGGSVIYRYSDCCSSSDPATISLSFTSSAAVAPPSVTSASKRFRVGERFQFPVAPLVVPGDLALNPASINIRGQQGGLCTYTPGTGGALGFITYNPNFQGCGTGGCTVKIADACGNSSNVGMIDITIDPPLQDCNHNCIVDSDPAEVDLDNDGLPDDCEINRSLPGSLLVVPLVDNRAGAVTLLTVTDVGTPAAGVAQGSSVDLEFVYINRFDQTGGDLPCLETNRTEHLTRGDTISLITAQHNPNAGLGFAYVFAKSATTGAAISWNRLAGSAVCIDSLGSIEESTQLLSFRALVPEGNPTDVNSDGRRDLNGIEYAPPPLEILIPRFLGQDTLPPILVDGRMVFLALSAGPTANTHVDLMIYDDSETQFSAGFDFRCWDIKPLSSVSGAFANDFLLGAGVTGNPIGNPPRECGWVRLRGGPVSGGAPGAMYAIYAVLLERLGPRCVAELPFEYGAASSGRLFGD